MVAGIAAGSCRRHGADTEPAARCPEAGLVYSRRERYRGGTLIADDVQSLIEHERRLRDPDGYRPKACPRCGHERLHLHDRWHRVLCDAGRRRVLVLRVIDYVHDVRFAGREDHGVWVDEGVSVILHVELLRHHGDDGLELGLLGRRRYFAIRYTDPLIEAKYTCEVSNAIAITP